MDALRGISDDDNFDTTARLEAQNILLKTAEFEFVLQTVFRNIILDKMNAVSKNKQDPKINLNVCCSFSLSSLTNYVLPLKDRYHGFEAEVIDT